MLFTLYITEKGEELLRLDDLSTEELNGCGEFDAPVSDEYIYCRVNPETDKNMQPRELY